MIRVW